MLVLVPVVGRLKCMVKCIKGGDGVCGKLLSSKNIAKSAKDHYTWNGCKGVRIEQGQATLQPGPSTTQSVGFKRAFESTDSIASSSKQACTGQRLIAQHVVSQHTMQQAGADEDVALSLSDIVIEDEEEAEE